MRNSKLISILIVNESFWWKLRFCLDELIGSQLTWCYLLPIEDSQTWGFIFKSGSESSDKVRIRRIGYMLSHCIVFTLTTLILSDSPTLLSDSEKRLGFMCCSEDKCPEKIDKPYDKLEEAKGINFFLLSHK